MRYSTVSLMIVLLAGTAASSLMACSSSAERVHMEARPPVAGGEAVVEAELEDEQGVTKVSIKAEHLGEPRMVFPTATNYVAWVRSSPSAQLTLPGQPAAPGQATAPGQPSPSGSLGQAGDWRRLGVLDYSAKSQDGKLRVTTSDRMFDLIITAESQMDPARPSPHVVFQKHIEAHR